MKEQLDQYDSLTTAPTRQKGPGDIEALTPRQIVWRNFRSHRMAMFGVLVLFLIIVVAISAPLIVKDPFKVDLTRIYREPSLEHPFGTDAIGRDYLSRVVYGGRVSLQVGIFVALIGTAAGTLIGAVSGYYAGKLDNVMMRVVDLVLALPALPVLLVAGAVWGSTLWSMTLILAAFSWAPVARIVRGSFLSLREREFVQAAFAAGASDRRIIFRHMLPNSLGPIVVFATLTAATAILIEATLSFLGFGIRPPTPSWGTLASDAKDVMFSKPWLLFPPGGAIVITALAINFIGDGLRDALDPTQLRAYEKQ